jgi:hypothetical protein
MNFDFTNFQTLAAPRGTLRCVERNIQDCERITLCQRLILVTLLKIMHRREHQREGDGGPKDWAWRARDRSA